MKKITEAEIKQAIHRLARELERCNLTQAVVVLKGAMHFASALLLEMANDLPVEFIAVSSYTGKQQFRPGVTMSLSGSCEGQNVLLIEDIIDSGNTVKHVHDLIRQAGGAATIRTVTLLQRESYGDPCAMLHRGFVIPHGMFAVGYGLDMHQAGRNKRDINFI